MTIILIITQRLSGRSRLLCRDRRTRFEHRSRAGPGAAPSVSPRRPSPRHHGDAIAGGSRRLGAGRDRERPRPRGARVENPP